METINRALARRIRQQEENEKKERIKKQEAILDGIAVSIALFCVITSVLLWM